MKSKVTLVMLLLINLVIILTYGKIILSIDRILVWGIYFVIYAIYFVRITQIMKNDRDAREIIFLFAILLVQSLLFILHPMASLYEMALENNIIVYLVRSLCVIINTFLLLKLMYQYIGKSKFVILFVFSLILLIVNYAEIYAEIYHLFGHNGYDIFICTEVGINNENALKNAVLNDRFIYYSIDCILGRNFSQLQIAYIDFGNLSDIQKMHIEYADYAEYGIKLVRILSELESAIFVIYISIIVLNLKMSNKEINHKYQTEDQFIVSERKKSANDFNINLEYKIYKSVSLERANIFLKQKGYIVNDDNNKVKWNISSRQDWEKHIIQKLIDNNYSVEQLIELKYILKEKLRAKKTSINGALIFVQGLFVAIGAAIYVKGLDEMNAVLILFTIVLIVLFMMSYWILSDDLNRRRYFCKDLLKIIKKQIKRVRMN